MSWVQCLFKITRFIPFFYYLCPGLLVYGSCPSTLNYLDPVIIRLPINKWVLCKCMCLRVYPVYVCESVSVWESVCVCVWVYVCVYVCVRSWNRVYPEMLEIKLIREKKRIFMWSKSKMQLQEEKKTSTEFKEALAVLLFIVDVTAALLPWDQWSPGEGQNSLLTCGQH